MSSWIRLGLTALLLGIGLPTSSAQNCSQTSVGLTPLPDLGAGNYLGFQGGLYPAGSNVRPILHTIDGMAQATAVVPRNAAGAPDPSGKIVFLSIGMSNCTQEFQRLLQLANADPLKHLPAHPRTFYPFPGGWLEHTLSVARTCLFLADRYGAHYPELTPPLNRDLVVAAAVLHDGRIARVTTCYNLRDWIAQVGGPT